MASQLKIWEVNLCPQSLYQDVPHGFDMLVSIIWQVDELSPAALNTSLLQWGCNEACEPIGVFHVSRPFEVLWYFPSAACWLMTMNLS